MAEHVLAPADQAGKGNGQQSGTAAPALVGAGPVDARPAAAAQRRMQTLANGGARAMQFKSSVAQFNQPSQPAPLQQAPEPNRTGLPDQLKAGVESLSSMSLDHVKVHYNSPQPAQLNAHAYAQGSEIHVGPGQEQHLPHEAWHVVQQAQGRVRPTMQAKGQAVNDDAGLEAEADAMGAQGLARGAAQLARQGHADAAPAAPARSLQLSAEHGERLAAINHEVAQAAHGSSALQRHALQRAAMLQMQAGRFLLDEGEPAAEGKIGKAEFLANMRAQVSAASQRILAPFGMAQADCPDLKYWVSHYEGKDAGYVEQVIARYAPDTAGADNPSDYLARLVQRIEAGLVEHTQTGKVIDPEPMPDAIDKQRAPLSVFGIQKKAMPVIQMGCASASSTAVEPIKPVESTEPVDPLKVTDEERAVNEARNRRRAVVSTEYDPEIRAHEQVITARNASRKEGEPPPEGAAATVAYPYTLEGARARTAKPKKTNEKQETATGSAGNAMMEYTTNLTRSKEEMGRREELPEEAMVSFRTAIGSGMLLIGEVYNNKIMSGKEVGLASILNLHLEMAKAKADDIDRVYIKDVVNPETLSYCMKRFPNKTELDTAEERKAVMNNTPFGGALKYVVPAIHANPSRITFNPKPTLGMHMTIYR